MIVTAMFGAVLIVVGVVFALLAWWLPREIWAATDDRVFRALVVAVSCLFSVSAALAIVAGLRLFSQLSLGGIA